jgi:hypothetical protein
VKVNEFVAIFSRGFWHNLEPRAEFVMHELQSNIVKLCTGSIQSVEQIPISRPPRSSLPVVEQDLNQPQKYHSPGEQPHE